MILVALEGSVETFHGKELFAQFFFWQEAKRQSGDFIRITGYYLELTDKPLLQVGYEACNEESGQLSLSF